jgi:hypothetical protein
LNTRPPGVPNVAYWKYSPPPKSLRSSQKKARNGLGEIADGSELFEKLVEQVVPRNRTPFDETETSDVLVPKPLKVKPSGSGEWHWSSPSSSTCAQPLRSSIEYYMLNEATIVFSRPGGPCGPTGP